MLIADHEGQRLVILESDRDGRERKEVAMLHVRDPAELAPFVEALKKAIGTRARDTLRGDPGPLERFQPPPEERLPDTREPDR